MKKWNLVFDVALCTGCQNCVLAVKDEYVGNTFPGYSAEMPRQGHRWVDIRRRERGRFPAVDVSYFFQACQHCDDAPCIRAAQNDAIAKRPDGIVLIDPERATGQRQIVDACPYGAVTWNDALALPQHWNFDAHLIDAGWAAPRPVQACPTAALRVLKVEDEEMQRIARDEGLERLEQGEANRTRVYYKNFSRINRVFVGGTLVGREAGLEACVAGAQVRLAREAQMIGTTASNAFGDFRFDALPPASGRYRVEVTAKGYSGKTVELELTDSQWLGEIRLEPA